MFDRRLISPGGNEVTWNELSPPASVSVTLQLFTVHALLGERGVRGGGDILQRSTSEVVKCNPVNPILHPVCVAGLQSNIRPGSFQALKAQGRGERPTFSSWSFTQWS